ncbi:MAG: choice-of-anchor D domain-containing protein [Bryobacteraceae bacterium]
MSDLVPHPPIGLTGGVYVKATDTAGAGVALGLACVSNGANVACAYKQSPDALVYFDGDGNRLWTSGDLLDAHIDYSAPLIQTDGSVVIGDDQHIYKFNNDGTIAWATPSPGGQPISLVTTPNGAIVSATDQVSADPCSQNNCQLIITVNYAGTGYTTASVGFSGGYCPGAAATASLATGKVKAITITTQGPSCIIPPNVTITGDGSGAVASAQLNSPAPLAIYDGFTGALIGTRYLYDSGTSGPYYQTINTPCVNNGTHPNRVYASTNLMNDTTQGMLWALDIDPTNLVSPVTPVWNVPFGGPSGASPLCIGDNVYFDGASYQPGDKAGTTIFGVQDAGASPTVLFHNSLGAGKGPVSCNFAQDPRPMGGFWHQLIKDPNIYHRDPITGTVIESVNMSNLLLANGAPPATYWTSGVFTTYGTPDHPYVMMSEYAQGIASYYTMIDVTTGQLIWALPIFPGNSPFPADSAEGAAAMVIGSSGAPAIAIASRYNGAYFVAEGMGTAALSATSLSLGTVAVTRTSASQAVTLTNTGSAVLSVGGVAVTGDFAQTNTCTAPLPPGAICSITVTFSPTAPGTRTGAITISDNAAGSPRSVALSGTGIPGTAAIGLSPSVLSYGDQITGTISPSQPVSLTNTGTSTFTLTSIVATADAGQTNNCPPTLAAGASCAINVMFMPGGAGARTGSVTITGNAANGPQTITISGNGLAATGSAAAVSSTAMVFPIQTAGTVSTPRTIKLTSAGVTPLNIASILATGDASQTNTCPARLQPGASCAITVTFAPTGSGPRRGAITITDDAPDSPQVVAVSGAAVGNPVPLINPFLAPASAAPGAAPFTLTLSGAGFASGSTLAWNGSPLATSVVGNAQLSASVPASVLAAAGTAAITVISPGPGGGTSNTAWFPVTTASASLEFSHTDLPAGGGPQGVATADFNGDGNLDIAVANSAANTVSVLLGNGDGTFSANVDYLTGSGPVAVAAGDLNGDGKPDLVSVNHTANTISVLLNNGDGTFASAVPYPTGVGPQAATMADFNADGILDVAVANRDDNTVSILRGGGAGTLTVHVDFPAGQSPNAVVAADFNGDGIPDLAVANNFAGGTVSILLATGGTSFQAPVAYKTGDSAALAASDFNRDGKIDLAAVNLGARTLSVLLGNGDGTFAAVASPMTCGLSCALSPGPIALTAGALSGDGTIDLAVVNRDAATVSVLQGNGNGTFRAATDYRTGSGPVAIAIADFNNDGSLDLAMAAPGGNAVSILRQVPLPLFSNALLNFGNALVGNSISQAVTLTNGGSAPLVISDITTSGHFSQTNTCGAPLPPGTNCSITLTFTPVGPATESATLTITDNADGGSQTVNLSGTGVAMSVSVSLSQPTVYGGNPIQSNTVILSSPAPAGGASITLSTSNAAVASIPASVLVAEGTTVSLPFSVNTTGVVSPVPVTLMATYGGINSSASLMVNPATLASLQLPAQSVTSGQSLPSNTVSLNGLAPPGGVVVKLYSSLAGVASLPTSVSIPAGSAISPAFAITAGMVSTPTLVVITATYGTTTLSSTVTVNPGAVASINLSPTIVTGGVQPTYSWNVVTLGAAAPPEGAVVALASSSPTVASIPATVTVPSGATTSLSFTITTAAVTARVVVTISATYNGFTGITTLTVNPPTPTTIKLSSTTVTGGSSITGNRVYLKGPAPAGNAVIALSSSNPLVAAVPTTVTALAGANYSQIFTITTTAVSSPVTVTISATLNTVTKSVTILVSP